MSQEFIQMLRTMHEQSYQSDGPPKFYGFRVGPGGKATSKLFFNTDDQGKITDKEKPLPQQNKIYF